MTKRTYIPAHQLPDTITLFNLFNHRSRYFFPLLGLFGVVNGVWGSALLLLINSKITGAQLPYFSSYSWLIYSVLIVVSFISALSFQSFLIRLTNKFGFDMRISILNKLRFTEYKSYLELGEQIVRTALEDVITLQGIPLAFIDSINAGVMTLIGFAYLFWINPLAAGFVILVMFALAAVYLYRNKKIRKDLEAARMLNEADHKNVIDLLRGFREIKMSTKRSDNLFYNYLIKNRLEYLGLRINAFIRSLGNNLLGTYVWYIIIGLVLYLMPLLFAMTVTTVASFLVTLLFLMGPVNKLIGTMESFIRFGVAIKRLNHFNRVISEKSRLQNGHGDLPESSPKFESVEFKQVTYNYFDENEKLSFSLGPIDLKIKRGECIFITGGNGSGKSTFIHLLTGLNCPETGQIILNACPIDNDKRAFYRNQLSAIFTDCYLFDENYDGFELQATNSELIALLEQMQLKTRISFATGRQKLNHQLSKGQQKRMALIYALLEQKEVLIFDEWAAEQDPEFRRRFYEVVIPELRQEGKTIIAVTHDDAYFHHADRIIKFDFGKVLYDEKLEQPAKRHTGMIHI